MNFFKATDGPRRIFAIMPICACIFNAFGVRADSFAERAATVVDFRFQKELPKSISSHYQQLFEDLLLADAGEVKFFTYKYSIDSETDGIFVKVVSNLTCSASGQCEIDLFSLNGGPKLLFRATAQNIAIESSDEPVASTAVRYPALITNIPRSVAERNTGRVAKISSGFIWLWNGATYKPAANNDNQEGKK